MEPLLSILCGICLFCCFSRFDWKADEKFQEIRFATRRREEELRDFRRFTGQIRLKE